MLCDKLELNALRRKKTPHTQNKNCVSYNAVGYAKCQRVFTAFQFQRVLLGLIEVFRSGHTLSLKHGCEVIWSLRPSSLGSKVKVCRKALAVRIHVVAPRITWNILRKSGARR